MQAVLMNTIISNGNTPKKKQKLAFFMQAEKLPNRAGRTGKTFRTGASILFRFLLVGAMFGAAF